MRLICAILLIIFAFCKSYNSKAEVDFEDAKEILPGRTYYWKNWSFRRDVDGYLHVWSEVVALKFHMHASGCLQFIIDYELWSTYFSHKLYNYSDSDYEYLLQTFKRMINSTTQAQPILSNAGSTKLTFGNWFLVSRKEGEMTIEYNITNIPRVITLREGFPGFTIESNSTNQTFSAKSLLGAEFSTSWIPRRKINQSSLGAEAHKSETEQQSHLTSCCTVNRKNSDEEWTAIQCDNKVRFHKINYLWNFDRIDLHRPADDKKKIIKSPSFCSTTYDKTKWYLELELGSKTSEEISLHLCRCPNSTETEALADLDINFLDSEGNLTFELVGNTFDTYSNDTCNCWGWFEIPSKKVVSPDNRLRIVCKIAVCEFTTNSFHLNRTDISMNPRNYNSKKIIHSLTQNNSENSDVTLVLSKTGKEYPANKSVLAASSPVFATMFNTGRTKKGEEIGRVNITDVDSELVMDELLKYIYTSKCENIETLAHDLLVAAHKYELYNLTELCIEKITNNLTVENAVDTLNLADKHGFDKLKSKTIRFIAANYAQVSNTSDWKQMEKAKNNEFLHEVCKILSNNSNNKEIAEV